MPEAEKLMRVHVTLPESLMAAMKEAADEADRTVTAEIARRLRESLKSKTGAKVKR